MTWETEQTFRFPVSSHWCKSTKAGLESCSLPGQGGPPAIWLGIIADWDILVLMFEFAYNIIRVVWVT